MLAALLVAGCGSDGAPAIDAGALDASTPDEASTVVRFQPTQQPMAFGAMAWPDDAYRDQAGRVRVSELPAGQGALPYAEALAGLLGELDGFGLSAPVYFFVDGGEVDPASLPYDAQASLAEGASAFVVDVDTNSTEAFQRVPVQVSFRPELSAVVLEPALGYALFPGRRYAAVLTDAVRDTNGERLGASARYAVVRDATRGLDTPLDQQVRARHAPVLQTLETRGLERARIAGLAVFTVQTVGTELADARAIVAAGGLVPPAVQRVVDAAGLGAVLGSAPPGTVGLSPGQGAPHDHLGWMIHGQFEVPNFLSANPGEHGAFERDEVGVLRVKRVGTVPFTLWLPMASSELSELPVVVFQHDMLRERSDALTLANQLAERGVAVVAVDAPFHGMRASNADSRNPFTGQPQPDGFGDEPGDFLGSAVEGAALPAGYPGYYRDALRQGAVELLAVFEQLTAGDWSMMGAVDARLAQLGFDADRIGFVGVGTGATMGLMAMHESATVRAAVLMFAPGRSVASWADSPERQSLVQGLLHRFDRAVDSLDLVDDAPSLRPELSLYQTAIDRADALAYAASTQRGSRDFLLLAAVEDEVVHLRHTEELARKLGLATLGAGPQYVAELPGLSAVPGEAVGGNFSVDGAVATRLFVPLSPAGHDAYLTAQSTRSYQHPLLPPYALLDEPVVVDNPVAALLDHVSLFFESRFTCESGPADKGCAARIVAP